MTYSVLCHFLTNFHARAKIYCRVWVCKHVIFYVFLLGELGDWINYLVLQSSFFMCSQAQICLLENLRLVVALLLMPKEFAQNIRTSLSQIITSLWSLFIFFLIKVRLCKWLHPFYLRVVYTEHRFLRMFFSIVLLLLCITEQLRCWIYDFSVIAEHSHKKICISKTVVQDQVIRQWAAEVNKLWEKPQEQSCFTEMRRCFLS